MIGALVKQKAGVGKTTLALHLAGQWARRWKRVTVIDADPQGSALDWSEQRTREGVPRLFGVIALARDTLHREAPEMARDVDHVVIDGPPRVAGLTRSALLTADLILIPAQPSPFDGWASAETLRLLREARIFRPQLAARFVLNRCAARTLIARDTADRLSDHDPPVLASRIGQRAVFAEGRAPAASSPSSIRGAKPPERSLRWRPKSERSRHDRAPGEASFCSTPKRSRRVGTHAGGGEDTVRWRRGLHRAAHNRRHGRAARPDQDRRLQARRDRGRHAARPARARVPR
jgi:chromosome partitioning protein